MEDLLTIISARSAAVLAILVNPYLLTRISFAKADGPVTFALTGINSILVNSAPLMACHMLGIPVVLPYLGMVHLLLGILLFGILGYRRLALLPNLQIEDSIPLLISVGFAFCVLPFTYLTGTDTYKWQDLASSIAVEQNIPWLVHPLSLLGFTPRAYPAAQPLWLAGIQILGGTGVDWGYYLVSVISGSVGILSAYVLARRIFIRPSLAAWCAFFYGFSPVFLRYNHWATGRGLFLSILPLFVLAGISLPQRRALIGAPLLGALLVCTHKTGWIALVLVGLALIMSALIPRRHGAPVIACLAAMALFLSICAAPIAVVGQPIGHLFGFLRASGARFAWALPFAIIGIVAFGEQIQKTAWRRIVCMLIVSLPLAAAEMYGAMIALIFLTLVATAGFAWVVIAVPRYKPVVQVCLVILIMIQAGITIGRRSLTATPRRIREAARFLEAYDPAGPYVVSAPAPVVSRIQAYVSGFPRFAVHAPRSLRCQLQPLPPFKGPLDRATRAWIAYLRNPFSFPGLTIAWYGESPRAYYVTVDNEGSVSVDASLLYSTNGVAIYGMPLPGKSPSGAPSP